MRSEIGRSEIENDKERRELENQVERYGIGFVTGNGKWRYEIKNEKESRNWEKENGKW